MLKSLAAIEHYRQEKLPDLEAYPWLRAIVSAEERIVNMERIDSLEELTHANPVLDYVERSLRLLDASGVSFWMKDVLEEVLAWSEAAKGGTSRERIRWQSEGINCYVHNIGSAQLYLRHRAGQSGIIRQTARTGYSAEIAEAAGSAGNSGNTQEARSYPFAKADAAVLTDGQTAVIHRLIEGHGLIGQQIRGEVPDSESVLFADLVSEGWITAEELQSLLVTLNACVIGAVSLELWREVEDEVKQRIHQVAYDYMTGEVVLEDRMRRMRALSIGRGENFDTEYEKLAARFGLDSLLAPLSDVTFWYAEPALQDFSLEQFLKIMALALPAGRHREVKHISFERLMNAMYYDYKGAKKINIYKKRIIEKYLSELDWAGIKEGAGTLNNPHLTHGAATRKGIPDTVFFEFTFSPAAEKLIEFCVEAEKSAIYEQAVLLLFDLFELRRDAYDRFHNEDVYLSDMNRTADYKSVILDDIVGEQVLDIGPGGGVLLDLMEERLPQVKPIGIDIATNVVEALKRKKQLEGRRWEVMQGDALDLKEYVEPGSIDTVVFSSILHELYSYIPLNGRKFNRDTIAAALKSAFDVLSEGGRIIIRDGIMTEPPEQKRIIRFLKEDGMQWLERYSGDFAGRRIAFEKLAGDKALLPVNDAMEFLYTYTWGEEAYVHEVQEQFGYFTLSEYRQFIGETLGDRATILKSRQYLQEGYTEALADKVELTDGEGREVPLPDSTCLIVIGKTRE